MSIKNILEITLFFSMVIIITKPAGIYIYRVLAGQKTFMSPILEWLENLLYKYSGINTKSEQSWFEYAAALIIFHLFGLILLFAILILQGLLPLNPQKFHGVEPILALNTAISFLTNTNWQSYVPEATMSYFSQMAGLAVHNFLSAAAGICVAVAFIRAFARREAGTIGNFWIDMIRITIYILLPMAVIGAIILIWQGVPQNFQSYISASQVDGGTQHIAQGPVASQEAIKMLGTNGGGFFNANSSHPYENPTPLSNMLEMLLMILLPAGLIYSFGLFVNDKKQGWTLFGAVITILILFTFITAFQESRVNPIVLRESGSSIALAGQDKMPLGNFEGKETRFGIGQSAIFSMLTTSISCGAVNNMHDSNMPLTGLLELFNMHLGEIIFGGVGSGLYVLLLFALLTVFIAGLMVGRTPEFISKKIGPQDIQLASAGVLFPSILILLMSAIVVFVPEALKSVSNPGGHGFSQLLYAYTSSAANNGSAFAGLNANTPYWNLTLALNMLLGRLVPIVLVLKLSGNIAAKKITPVSSGTLPTNDLLFAILLAAIIIIIGGLTFLPALAIGPLSEHMLLFY